MRIASTRNAEHYVWAEACDGWRLLDDPALSVIQERVPPGKSEHTHRHAWARQFFYILEGRAEMCCAGETLVLERGQGVEVPPGVAHQFRNPFDCEVVFLVISSPSTRGDREDLPAA
ncbi:cupin domain-containing protein [Niveibacterium sp. 24ML]|uniref:cupin domain-containing protein n=1 Tax=Niveibacterium sp. 24ML TaxID=2985512 RepID=UPI002270B367|nr:cupin domain-containing protein [Niveibacterium sp. 24ML]MCX9155006.1 cupin domain-containing protein [Niveibacterium sp. 24ML]